MQANTSNLQANSSAQGAASPTSEQDTSGLRSAKTRNSPEQMQTLKPTKSSALHTISASDPQARAVHAEIQKKLALFESSKKTLEKTKQRQENASKELQKAEVALKRAQTDVREAEVALKRAQADVKEAEVKTKPVQQEQGYEELLKEVESRKRGLKTRSFHELSRKWADGGLLQREAAEAAAHRSKAVIHSLPVTSPAHETSHMERSALQQSLSPTTPTLNSSTVESESGSEENLSVKERAQNLDIKEGQTLRHSTASSSPEYETRSAKPIPAQQPLSPTPILHSSNVESEKNLSVKERAKNLDTKEGTKVRYSTAHLPISKLVTQTKPLDIFNQSQKSEGKTGSLAQQPSTSTAITEQSPSITASLLPSKIKSPSEKNTVKHLAKKWENKWEKKITLQTDTPAPQKKLPTRSTLLFSKTTLSSQLPATNVQVTDPLTPQKSEWASAHLTVGRVLEQKMHLEGFILSQKKGDQAKKS